MAERYRVFASHLLFKEVAADALGHLFRAGELGTGGLRRIVWLRVFDSPLARAAELSPVLPRAERIAASVHSVNLAAGVQHLADEGVAAVAHDYVASQPLSVVFDRAASEDFPIPIDNALLITEKISLALSAALAAEVDGERIVHGLIHPALVFVTYDGECVVAGFGMGEQLLGALGAAASPSLEPYLAPEVLVSRTASRRGDVYSLGAILFHLLTGHALPAEPADRQQAIDGATLAGDDAAIPGDIRTLLARSLTARPQERFSSASDLKKELDRLLYGGSYSPTTFNLALFMDRLFRAESEADERAVIDEQSLDVEPYLAPPVVPPEPQLEEVDEARSARSLRPLLAGGAAIVVAAVVVGAVVLGRGRAAGPPPEPTPTAAEIAAQRQAQEDRMRELAESLVREMMAEKEAEIRAELTERQAKIDDLQRRLHASEAQARAGQLSREEARQREELMRQIAAEEEAQRQREADLEAERQRADDAAIEQARSELTGTAAAGTQVVEGGTGAPSTGPRTPEEAAGDARAQRPTESAPARAAGTATVLPEPTPTAPPLPPPTAVPIPTPSPVPPAPMAAVVAPPAFNAFVEPTAVDSLPVAIKYHPPEWSQAALRSRRRGVIIIQATVDGSGEVVDAKVLRADDGGFGIPEAALAAARRYRFKPGTVDGVAVTTYATVTVPYRFDAIR